MQKLGMVVHSCDPKAEIRRIMVQGQPRQKVTETPISTKKQGVMPHHLEL
jgi:hypothetical protein